MQHALRGRPDDVALRAAEAELLRDRRVSPFSRSTGRSVIWRDGFIRAAYLHETSGLRRLLLHPAARFLRALWLVENADLVAVLGDQPAPGLRELYIAVAERPTIDLDLRAYTQLAHVEVDGFELGIDGFPSLRRLHVRATAMPSLLRAVAEMPGERLAELELRSERTERGLALAPMFARDDLALLRTLRVAGEPDGLIELVVRAPFAPQLETIDLGSIIFAREDRLALAAAAPRLTALQHLVLHRHCADAELRAAFGRRLRDEAASRPSMVWPG